MKINGKKPPQKTKKTESSKNYPDAKLKKQNQILSFEIRGNLIYPFGFGKHLEV